MNSILRIPSLIFFTFFTLCLPAQLNADPLDFFKHLSPHHKIKFIVSSAACFAGVVGVCAINAETTPPANNNVGQDADDSHNSSLTTPNTVPKFMGTLLCGVIAFVGGFLANEASYGR